MHVVIIGAGGAGLATAWLLGPHHRVTLLERTERVGGHVRTLGGNLPGPDPDLRLDCGVVEFERGQYLHVLRMLERLRVPVRPVPVATTFNPHAGRTVYSPKALDRGRFSVGERAVATLDMLRVGAGLLRFRGRVRRRSVEGLTLGALLGDSVADRWLRALAMYCYTTPSQDCGAISAAASTPMLLDVTGSSDWVSVVGGTFAYIERLLEELQGALHLGCEVRAVRRTAEGVEVDLGAERLRADAVVFAVPPDQVLRLLEDPSPEERRRFSPWRTREVRTCIHHDLGPYARRGLRVRTEGDFFERADGRIGYSVSLEHLAGLGPGSLPYAVGFELEGELDPALVDAVIPHTVPCITPEAVAGRQEILDCNGQRSTWFAGAWLGDGVHESAIASAARVSKGLGGELL